MTNLKITVISTCLLNVSGPVFGRWGCIVTDIFVFQVEGNSVCVCVRVLKKLHLPFLHELSAPCGVASWSSQLHPGGLVVSVVQEGPRARAAPETGPLPQAGLSVGTRSELSFSGSFPSQSTFLSWSG